MKMKKIYFLRMVLFVLFVYLSIGGKMSLNADGFKKLNNADFKKLNTLSNYKIFFGHQSVGYNILDGIEDIMNENGDIKFTIKETTNPADYTKPILGHARAGENRYPQSKVDAFVDFLNVGIGDNIDIAFLKFCYVDINADTDITQMFDSYKNAILKLKRRYPHVIFVHFTVPLISREKGLKTFAKKMLRRSLRGYEDNIKRNQYNELLKKEYAKKEPVFDIAAIESTSSDGKRNRFSKDGETYYAMFDEYTSDGGHLNEKGRKIVAEQLLIFLSELER